MKEWVFHPVQKEARKTFADKLGVSLHLAQVLLNRNISSAEEATSFLEPRLSHLPNPFDLPDMHEATSQIIEAIEKKDKITLYGDYDVDGVSSTALFVTFFRQLGIQVSHYIPMRSEGYGLNCQAIESLFKEGTKLLITADCGTKSIEEIKFAQSLGMKVIVTDHHDLPKKLPNSPVVNPKRIRGESHFKDLAGVGVVFFLLAGLRLELRKKKLFEEPLPNLKKLLDLVALGTVADLVPLTKINRILVTYGLEEIAKTDKVGLIALKEISGVRNKRVATTDIGFRLGPRINAGGRIARPELGLELLLSQDPIKAKKLSQILQQCNEDRQALQETQLGEAFRQLEGCQIKSSIVLDSPNWHAGILGLIASKILEEHYRPTIVFNHQEGLAKGSARSIPSINIVSILDKCAHLLKAYGGHKGAAGLHLDLEKLPEFRELFESETKKALSKVSLQPTIFIDSEVSFEDLSPQLLEEIEKLRPFGMGNPAPTFSMKNAQLNYPKIVGNHHLKFQVCLGNHQIDAIAFGAGPLFSKSSRADLAFSPQYNEYQGKRIMQLKVKDLKVAK